MSIFSLMLVTDDHTPLDDLVHIVKAAVQGGVTAVQLRRKLTPIHKFIEESKTLLAHLRPLHIPLIINDQIEVAHITNAHGVHLGQKDVAISEARHILGRDAFIGLSVSTLDEAEKASRLDVNYMGAGPIFPTTTKKDAAAAMGCDMLEKIVARAPCPVVAIGGITLSNAASVYCTGCAGLAIVSALCHAPSPFHAAQNFKQLQQGKV